MKLAMVKPAGKGLLRTDQRPIAVPALLVREMMMFVFAHDRTLKHLLIA